MKRSFVPLLVIAALGLALSGCGQAAPVPTPTKAPAVPTKPAEPTKAAAPTKPAEPTKAAGAQPTAAISGKVDYPTKGKSITLIVPFDAGGATDVGARLLAPLLEKDLGIPIQVVNKPGGGTQIGLTELIKSKPDGYTMATTTLPTAILSYLDPQRKAPYSRKDFQPVANQVWDPGSIAVGADSPYKTLKDFIDAAKTNPAKIKVGTSGVMTNTHLDILMLEKVAEVKFALVHFTGSAPMLNALMGGHVDALVQTVGSSGPQVRSGQARFLGVMDRQESEFFPGVKTMEAQGYRVYGASSRGYSVPAGTPPEIVDVLSQSIKKGTANPDFKKRMDETTQPLRLLDPAQYAAYWDEMESQIRPLAELAQKELAGK